MLTITDENFINEVIISDVPVLVYCWQPGYSVCEMMDPIVEKLAAEFSKKIKVGKLNIKENPKIVDAYQIICLPSHIIFEGGKIARMITGVYPEFEFRKFLTDE